MHAIVAAWAFAVSYIFTLQVIQPTYPRGFVLYSQILNRTADAPYAYRLLAPWMIRLIPLPFPAAYTSFALFAIEFSAFAIFQMLRRWYDDQYSLFGASMYCALVAVASHHDMFQPWSQLEPGFYALAVILGLDRRFVWALLLAVLAAINRETGLFVPLLFGLSLPENWKKRASLATVLIAAWFAVFYSLPLIIGPRPHPHLIAECFRDNILPRSLALSTVASAAFFAIVFPAIWGWKIANATVRRCTFILPLFVPLKLAYGLWWEVRHWLPLACILIPLAVSGITSLSRPGDRLRFSRPSTPLRRPFSHPVSQPRVKELV